MILVDSDDFKKFVKKFTLYYDGSKYHAEVSQELFVYTSTKEIGNSILKEFSRAVFHDNPQWNEAQRLNFETELQSLLLDGVDVFGVAVQHVKKAGAAVQGASMGLPAMNVKVRCPVGDVSQNSLWVMIQHLNDQHRWTREKIADWVDELHEAGIINAEFKPWGEEEKPKTSKGFATGGQVHILTSQEDDTWEPLGWIDGDKYHYQYNWTFAQEPEDLKTIKGDIA